MEENENAPVFGLVIERVNSWDPIWSQVNSGLPKLNLFAIRCSSFSTIRFLTQLHHVTKRSVLRRQCSDTNRNIKRLMYWHTDSKTRQRETL